MYCIIDSQELHYRYCQVRTALHRHVHGFVPRASKFGMLAPTNLGQSIATYLQSKTLNTESISRHPDISRIGDNIYLGIETVKTHAAAPEIDTVSILDLVDMLKTR